MPGQSASNGARLRKRTTCHGCDGQGQYRAIEINVRYTGFVGWMQRFLCAVCLTHLYQLIGPEARRWGGARPGARAAADVEETQPLKNVRDQLSVVSRTDRRRTGARARGEQLGNAS